MAKCGFDTTDFGSLENWYNFRDHVGLKYIGRDENIICSPFTWQTHSGTKLQTQNNSETGEYWNRNIKLKKIN